jgi:acetolactate synthase-1/2/3 large subunit
VTIVVFQDESLALIALKQAQAGLSSRAVTLGQTDFAAIARGFGGHGETVTDAAALTDALAAAAGRPGFSLIACRFDADDYRDAF